MNLKKIIAAAACFTIAAGLSGCGNIKKDSGKLSIVCTIFPEYDWTREILGSHAEDVELTYLLNSGADLHNFQPTADDMITISDCDIFIYVGGESDGWVDDALSETKNKDMKVIDLMDVIGDSAKEEEVVEGMEAEEEEEEEEEPEYDEHIWLSLRNAGTCCRAITDALCEKDKDNADSYRKNLESYLGQLDELDGQFAEMIGSAKTDTLIFGDRFPFRYFTDDYGLKYYAAFVGCSAETEASFSTIAFLAEKADELGAGTIFTIEGSDKSIARSVIESTSSGDIEIAELDSVQSVSDDKVKSGATYIDIMKSNYDVLKEALN